MLKLSFPLHTAPVSAPSLSFCLKKKSPTCSGLVVSEKLLNVIGLASEYFRRGFGFVSVAREGLGEGRAADLLSLIKTVFGFY